MIFKTFDFKNEEFWKTLTHAVGAVLSIVAMILMVIYATLNGSTLEIVSAVVFGMGLILLYSASTIYHATEHPEKKKIYRKLDHLCIYLLIAGTYTPVMLIGLGGTWGWAMFMAIWTLVILGFIFKFSPWKKHEKLSLALYALMGWMAVVAIKPMWENLTSDALLFLGLGGLAYTVGIVFYANKKIPFNHLIWHLFVLAGSAFHFFGVFWYILP